MKTKNKISVLLIAFLFAFSIPIIGRAPSTVHNNTDYKDAKSLQSSNLPIVYEWNRTWGGISNGTYEGSSFDRGNGITLDSSGNIYIVGDKEISGTGTYDNYDMCLVKYDSSGELQWNRTWGASGRDYGRGIALDSSGNIYIVGDTEKVGTGTYDMDMYLVKYDSAGVLQWNRTWGGSSHEQGKGIALDSSGNIYIAGSTDDEGTGIPDMCIVKYDSSGVLQWYKIRGGGNKPEHCNGIALDSSDNIYLVGVKESAAWHGSYDMCLVKFDSSGVQQWLRMWGAEVNTNYYDCGYAIALDSSDNIYIVGETQISYALGYDIALVKYDSSGVLQWYRRWSGNNYDYGFAVTVDSSDNIYIAGSTYDFGAVGNDMCLVNYDSSGTQQWNRTWDRGSDDRCMGIALDSSYNIYLTGSTRLGKYDIDVCLVKYKHDIPIDSIPPITTINLDGTFFFEDWYYPNVEITLSSIDDNLGVLFTRYEILHAHVNYGSTTRWDYYTDPFSTKFEGTVYLVSYYSRDNAGNNEVTKSTLIKVIHLPITFSYYIKITLTMLRPYFFGLQPEWASTHHLSALSFLEKSLDTYELGMILETFDHIKNSMDSLKEAVDKGLDSSWTQEAIKVIMFLLRYLVNENFQETLDIVNEENKFVVRAEADYNTALQMIDMEKYGEAVKFLKFTYQNLMKVKGESIVECFIDDLQYQIEQIQDLQTTGIPNEVLNYLNQAESKLLLAIDKANNSMLAQSLIQLKDAVRNLLDAEELGIGTIDIVNSILENADDVAYLKIQEAESFLMGISNRHIDKAWINYYKAIDYWNAGKYDFALGYYAKAIEKVNDALA